MNVDKIGQRAIDAYVQKPQTNTDKVAPSTAKPVEKSQRDEVSISSGAKELQGAQDAVQRAPDVREEKVAAIKKQIQEGTYNVSAEALVEKLMSVFKHG